MIAEIVERTDGIPICGGDDEGGAGGRGRGPAYDCGGSVSGPVGPREVARVANGAASSAVRGGAT